MNTHDIFDCAEAECQLCDTNVERGRAFALGYFLGLNVD